MTLLNMEVNISHSLNIKNNQKNQSHNNFAFKDCSNKFLTNKFKTFLRGIDLGQNF